MRLEYGAGTNRVFRVEEDGEEFSYIAADEALALVAHREAFKQLLGKDSTAPRIKLVDPWKPFSVMFANLEQALLTLGPGFIDPPRSIPDTGEIVLKMPACTWARTVDVGFTKQLASSVF
jgi:hypothetical protein